jgi:hypothetical protein
VALPAPQVQGFVCGLVGWLQGLAPFILMLSLAASLLLSLATETGTRLTHRLFIPPIVALILINLGAILGALGLSHC